MSQNRRGQKEKGQTLFLALRSLKEAWTKVKRIGKITPERKTRMQPNWRNDHYDIDKNKIDDNYNY